MPREYAAARDLAPLIAAPFWTAPFTSMFLHGGWMHLGGNMLYLWIFGDNIEHRKFGLTILRTAWISMDWIWAGALLVTGLVVLGDLIGCAGRREPPPLRVAQRVNSLGGN